jgi:hypothetical protein
MSEQDEPGPGQGGGVKAMLSRIKEQFRESHVQLPDGTIPKGKLNIGKRTLQQPKVSAPIATEVKLVRSEAGLQGVKAKLAELNSKYSGSFVQLPDGTVSRSVSTAKKAAAKDEREENQDDIAAQDIPIISQSGMRVESNIFCDYPPGSLSIVDDRQNSRVYSDYETVPTYSQERQTPNGERRETSQEEENGYPKTSSKTFAAYESSYSNYDSALAVTSSVPFNPPPLLLDKKKGSKLATWPTSEDYSRALNISGHYYVSEHKSAKKHLMLASSRATAIAYGIGVSFKPNEKGHLEVSDSSFCAISTTNIDVNAICKAEFL